jgi:tetratricopeptide (TPR) repeat protein
MTSPAISQAGAPPGRRLGSRLGLVIAIAATLGGTAYIAWRSSQALPLPDGVSDEEYHDAERKFEKGYRRTADHYDILSLLGEKAVGDGRLSTSLACFREIPSEHSLYGLSARLQEAQILSRLNRAREAEAGFREYLARTHGQPAPPREHLLTAYKRLTYLLSVELRFEERKAVLLEQHAAGLADVFDSKQLYFPHLLIWHSQTGRKPLGKFLEQDPQNRQLRTASGRYQTYEGLLKEARSSFEEVLREEPTDAQATAGLLECYFEGSDWAAFAKVVGSLGEPRENEPWLLTRMRGEFALHERRWEDAVSSFERLLKVDPANPWSHMGLARAYGELGRAEAREAEQGRSLVIARMRVALANVTERDPEESRKLASDCEQIGFPEAAETFREHALRIEGRPRRGTSSDATPR